MSVDRLTQVRTDTANTGRKIGEAIGNSKAAQAADKAVKAIGQSFVDYGKAVNKAAQQTVYGNMETPFATGGGVIKGLYEVGVKGAARGAGTGLLAEFGARSVNNIYNDVIRGSK
ncbi:hypothetical protein [Metasolibacillus meyeri]|uniref:hypothetical protein n=1 Tax=Metasolibacillus meyeri TaxID=1071052 RepID=UPI000D309DC4|nr:hypothetical protein [Metasolibacillus meyeri]